MQDLNEEALEVSTTLRIQRIFQGYVVLLQVHVLHRVQVSLWVGAIKRMSHTFRLSDLIEGILTLTH